MFQIKVGKDYILLFFAVIVFEYAHALAIVDVIAELDQVGIAIADGKTTAENISSDDRLALNRHIIFTLKNILNLFLA